MEDGDVPGNNFAEPEPETMPEAWIGLECPACGEDWEGDPADLPAPDSEFTCQHCGEERSMAEFAKTQRGLEILRSFH